ncbi:MAG: hypothetical protein ACI4XP_07345 [Acutalibacteraceae bacterium]
MTKKIFTIGIITCILYFISVGLFLITKTEIALTIWELMTVLSAPVLLFVLLEISTLVAITSIYKKAMLAFMSCTCSLTGVAHIVNITVTRALISEGIEVPAYFQIGCWPSVEMAIDYLAWGFFIGLAFLCLGISIKDKDKIKHSIKVTILTCGILCLIGFFGTIFIDENIWYVAPMGYGIGTMIVCIQMLKFRTIK